MKTRLVKIGNSRGIRIPRTLIEQAGQGGELVLQVKNDAVVIRWRKQPRAGWAAAFAAMHRSGDDHLLEESAPSRWDEEEWEW